MEIVYTDLISVNVCSSVLIKLLSVKEQPIVGSTLGRGNTFYSGETEQNTTK